MADRDEAAAVLALLSRFFEAPERAAAWMAASNPLLGGQAPAQMIEAGRGDKLLRFVKNALEENERP